jgi:hypothetical protein
MDLFVPRYYYLPHYRLNHGLDFVSTTIWSGTGDCKAMAATISTFVQSGAVFNSAIHLGSAGAVVGDPQTVPAALQTKVAGGQINSAGFARIQRIDAGLRPRLIAANAAGDGDEVYGSVAKSQLAIRSLHPGAVGGLRAESTLVALAMADDAAGLRVVPKGFAPGVTSRNATFANLGQIGANCDAADLMLVGVNTINVGAIEADIDGVCTDLQQLTAAHPGSERRAGSRAHRVVR